MLSSGPIKLHKIIDRIENMKETYIDDLVQDCSNSSANALELLQSCTKPMM